MKKYSNEFKQMVMKIIVDEQKPTGRTAIEFGIPIKTVEKWVTEYRKNRNCFHEEYTKEMKEIKNMAKQYKKAQKEITLLKKTINMLSKKTL